jgi:uncharacterized protein (TIGR02597 family)
MKKHYIILSAAAALAVSSPMLNAQTAASKPVGVRTVNLVNSQFNLLGVNLTQPIGVAGTIDTVSGTTLTDNEATFTTAYATPSTKLLLKLLSGPNEGVVQEITSFTATTVTTAQNISSLVAVGTKYEVRKVDTVESVFGASASSALQSGSSTTADLVYIPDGAGGFKIIFNSSGGLVGAGWRQVGAGSADSKDVSILYTDSVYVLRRGVTGSLTFTGHVIPTKTTVGLEAGFNYVALSLPVGVTLSDSGLQAGLTAGSSTTADKVYIPNGTGGFNIYFVSSGGLVGAGWRQIGGGSADASASVLTSGFIVQKTSASNVNLLVPTSLDI